MIIRYRGPMNGFGRPRMTRQGRMYLDASDVAFRQRVRALVDAQALTDGPLDVRLIAYVRAPKSQRAAIERMHKAPDVDNIVKPIFDAVFKLPAKRLTKSGKLGTRWDDGLAPHLDIDDSRVQSLTVVKYSCKHMEGFDMTIEQLVNDDAAMYAEIFEHLAPKVGRTIAFKGAPIDGLRAYGRQIVTAGVGGVAVYESANGDCTIVGLVHGVPTSVSLED